MTDFGEQVKQGIAPSSEGVILSEQADKDLERVGRFTRRLLERTVRDELLAPTSTSSFESLSLRGKPTAWFAVPVGKFKAVFRPLDDLADSRSGEEQRLVGRIVLSHEVENSLNELLEGESSPEAEAAGEAAAETQPAEAESPS